MKRSNVREMLISAKVPSHLADMSIPYMFFLPGSSDPDAQGVIEIIGGLQNLLGLSKSGVLDQHTARRLTQMLGSHWPSKTWVRIYTEVMNKKQGLTSYDNAMLPSDLGDAGDGLGNFEQSVFGDFNQSVFGQADLGDTSWDGGIMLDFTIGKTSITPNPRSSGGTYGAFKFLQYQINRAISQKGKRIVEDGVIGPATHKALLEAQDIYKRSFLGSASPLDMAKQAVTLGRSLEDEADKYGFKALPATSGGSVPAPLPEVPQLQFAEPKSDFQKYLPYLIAGGGIAFLAAMSKKGKRK